MNKQQQKRPHENPNPECHPHVQALIDLETAGFYGAHEILAALMDNSDEMKITRQKLRETWNAHQYPNKSIYFVMSGTYDRCPERFTLSLEAQAILGLMERLQSKQDGAVAVKKRVFATALNFSKQQTERFQRYLNELEQANLIRCISKPPQGSHSPAVYTVNRQVTWLGIQHNPTAPNVSVEGFKRLYRQTTEEIVLPNGSKMKCGTLGEYQEEPEKRKNGDAEGTADADSPEYNQNPASDDSINYNDNNNQ